MTIHNNLIITDPEILLHGVVSYTTPTTPKQDTTQEDTRRYFASRTHEQNLQTLAVIYGHKG